MDFQSPNITDLHSFWDLWLGHSPTYLPPTTDSQQLEVNATANQFMNEFAPSYFGEKSLNNLDVDSWLTESWEVARDYVYKDLKSGEIPSATYLERGYKVCRERITLAGYRLARILVKVFGEHLLEEQIVN